MRHRVLILVAASLLAGCFPDRPSVLVILLDDARPDELPGLAEDGLTFTNAYVTSPSCGPSRANFLTGRHRASRVNGWPSDFDQSDTIATRMRDAGYRTGFFGKYMNGAQLAGVKRPAPGWGHWQSLEHPVESYGFTTRNAYGIEWQPPGHADEWMLGEVIDWLERTPGPTFAIWAPHGPHVDGNYHVVPPDSYVVDADHYDHATRAREFGRFFADAVDEVRARFPSLVVVLTSDNGFARGDHGVNGKACPWRACVNVPLHVYGSLLPPSVYPQPVVLEDVAATILAVAGARTDRLDGCDLRLRRGSRCRREIPFENGGNIFGNHHPFERFRAILDRRGVTIEWDPRDTDRGREFVPRSQWFRSRPDHRGSPS